jgi:hypothetical protein
MNDNVVDLFTKRAVEQPEKEQREPLVLPSDEDQAALYSAMIDLCDASTVEAYSHAYYEVVGIMADWPRP